MRRMGSGFISDAKCEWNPVEFLAAKKSNSSQNGENIFSQRRKERKGKAGLNQEIEFLVLKQKQTVLFFANFASLREMPFVSCF
jgi:hypothetical protein